MLELPHLTLPLISAHGTSAKAFFTQHAVLILERTVSSLKRLALPELYGEFRVDTAREGLVGLALLEQRRLRRTHTLQRNRRSTLRERLYGMRHAASRAARRRAAARPWFEGAGRQSERGIELPRDEGVSAHTLQITRVPLLAPLSLSLYSLSLSLHSLTRTERLAKPL